MTEQIINNLEKKLYESWNKVLQSNDTFINMLEKKEAGHSIAGYVDTQTVTFIKNDFVNFQIKKEKNKRSLGDFWLKENNSDYYIPFNVKTGTKINGSPNIVSFNKIFNYLVERKINRYFLFIILFQKNENGEWKINVCKIINILNYSKYLSYDYGPQQIMLKEDKFVKDLKNNNLNVDTNISIKDVLKNLYALASDNNKLEKFINNRKEKLRDFEKKFSTFDSNILKLNQENLKLLDYNSKLKKTNI